MPSPTGSGSPAPRPPVHRRPSNRWGRVGVVLAAGLHLATLLPLPGEHAPGAAARAVAQEKQRPLPDDPFAEELNPFPKGDAEKPRTGQTPRTTKPKSTKPKDDKADDRSTLPLPFPEANDPKQDAGMEGGREAADAGEAPKRARPKAKPMVPGADLLPFPEAGAADALDDDSPVRDLLLKAEKIDRKGRHEEAKKLVLQAIEEEPGVPLVWLALGIVNRHLGDFHGSVEACSKGLRLDPTDAELSLRRGISWFHLGRHGIALEDFQDAAGFAFEDPRPELWRGLTLMELDRPLEAISAYSSAIRRDRNYDLAYLNRGLAYLETNEPEKAETDFDHAIRVDPRDARAWFNRGVAQARQGQYADAIDSYQEALRIDSSMEPARRNLEATRGRARRSSRPGSVLRPSAAAELVPAGRPVVSPATLGG